MLYADWVLRHVNFYNLANVDIILSLWTFKLTGGNCLPGINKGSTIVRKW